MQVKRIAFAALIGMVGVSAPALAQEKDERSWSSPPVQTGSDADKTIARAQAVKKCLEHILKDWSFTAVRGEARKTLMHSMFDILREERFAERRGKWSYSAKVSMSEARNRVMDALQVQDTFGADQMIVVVHPECYKGPGIDQDDVDAVWDQIRTGVSDYLNRHRFREAPNTGQKQQVMKAALELGASPNTQQLQGFSQAFQAPIVVSVHGKVRFEDVPEGSAQYAAGYRGYFRTQGLVGQIYDRNTDTILGRFAIKSTDQKSEANEADTDSIHQPYVLKGGSVSEAAEKYAMVIGQYVAIHTCKRLFERYYAMQAPAPPAGATAGPRDCPGCGDKIVDPALTTCPACESDLPGASSASAGSGETPPAGPRAPTARDYYQIRLKGFGDDDVETLIEALQANKDFSRWQDVGSVQVFYVYKCVYVGETLITSAVKDALKEVSLYDGCKVTKTGNNINVIRTK